MAVNNPADLNTVFQQQIASLVTQAVTQVAANTEQRLTTLEQQVATQVSAVAGPIVGDLIHTVETDTTTQRYLIWGIAGAVMVAALAILGFALLGNSTALKWIGAAPAAAGALVLWLSDAGGSLPKPAVRRNA